MADIVRLIIGDGNTWFVNRNLITDWLYLKDKDVTLIQFVGEAEPRQIHGYYCADLWDTWEGIDDGN